MKYIFVTGGVVSSLGKGLTSASIGMLLERRGMRVRMQKLDPYHPTFTVYCQPEEFAAVQSEKGLGLRFGRSPWFSSISCRRSAAWRFEQGKRVEIPFSAPVRIL